MFTSKTFPLDWTLCLKNSFPINNEAQNVVNLFYSLFHLAYFISKNRKKKRFTKKISTQSAVDKIQFQLL